MADLTKERAEQLFDYDAGAGILRWKVRPLSEFMTESAGKRWNTLFAGKIAGGIHPTSGYVVVTLEEVKYPAHRIIWTIETGSPPVEIDHEDGNRSNNRFKNLRDVDRQRNSMNRGIRSDCSSGITGVVWSERDKRWRARININGKQELLGTFTDFDQAVLVRKNAERLYGYHKNHASPDRPSYSEASA